MTTMSHNVGHVTPDNFSVAVGLGHHRGWRVLRKFAMNPDVAGTEQVWPPGTIQVLPTTAGAVSVVSDSAADVMTSGTGAWTCRVWGLDANYEEINETVELNGTTPVVTTLSFLRVFRAYAVLAGTGGVNAGNLSMSIGGDLQAYIEQDEGQTHISQYTVPAGHVAVLNYYTAMSGRVGNADLAVRLQIKRNGESWRTFSDTFPYEGSFTLARPLIILEEKTDVRALVVTDGVNNNVAIEWSGYLVEDMFYLGDERGTVAP